MLPAAKTLNMDLANILRAGWPRGDPSMLADQFQPVGNLRHPAGQSGPQFPHLRFEIVHAIQQGQRQRNSGRV